MRGGEVTGTELTAGEVLRLLELADLVVTWTTQDTLKRSSAGLPHLVAARQEYFRTRLELLNAHGHPLTTSMTGGCTCRWTGAVHRAVDISEDCMYHYAARLQPWNHKIPWNCPTYYDGCNCEKGHSETDRPGGPA
jgi:hypothetical protein